MFQRISTLHGPTEFPQESLLISHAGKKVCVTCPEPPKGVQQNFQDLLGLCFYPEASTLCNAPKWPALREQLDLSLRELTESTFNKDIFSSFDKHFWPSPAHH